MDTNVRGNKRVRGAVEVNRRHHRVVLIDKRVGARLTHEGLRGACDNRDQPLIIRNNKEEA